MAPCEFSEFAQNQELLASGWAPEEHKDGSVGKVIADASESEASLAGVEIAKSLQPAGRFRLSFRKTEGKETARLGFGVEEEDPAGVQEDRHHRHSLHNFRHTVGTLLAEMGEHQLMIRDYLRHSDLHVTNKYLQATTKSKRLAQGKLVDAILPGGVLSGSKSTLIH